MNQFSNDSLYGDLSAILIENAPFWVDIIRTPKQKIALLEDFEEKLNLITKSTVNENVTSISGVPSWYLVLIKQILAYTGRNNLLDVWPNLEVFFHGGISFTPYREQYKKLIAGDQMNYMETYNASEGFLEFRMILLEVICCLCSITEFFMNSFRLIKLMEMILRHILSRKWRQGLIMQLSFRPTEVCGDI